MPAIIALAAQIIPQLIALGMDIVPTIEALVNATPDNVEQTKAFLHQQRAAALAIINDKSRDLPNG